MAVVPIFRPAPAFTLTRSVPHHCKLGKLFSSWPSSESKLLVDAQTARDALSDACKRNGVPASDRLQLVDAYLPLAIAISRFLASSPAIGVTSERIRWTQTPVVTQKYRDRNFNGSYWHCEILHLIWLRGVLLLNIAAVTEAVDVAVSKLKEAAGVFQFLVNEPVPNYSADQIPIEFQPQVLNCFISLALGQAYALIVAQGASTTSNYPGLANVCFTSFVMLSSALLGLKEVPAGVIHPQFVNWVTGQTQIFHAAAALFLCFVLQQQEQFGEALSLIRVGIVDLEAIVELDSANKSLNESGNAMLDPARALNAEWTNVNFRIYSRLVPEREQAEYKLTNTCKPVTNLPQPIPYTPS
jgi:hypothetical protein